MGRALVVISALATTALVVACAAFGTTTSATSPPATDASPTADAQPANDDAQPADDAQADDGQALAHRFCNDAGVLLCADFDGPTVGTGGWTDGTFGGTGGTNGVLAFPAGSDGKEIVGVVPAGGPTGQSLAMVTFTRTGYDDLRIEADVLIEDPKMPYDFSSSAVGLIGVDFGSSTNRPNAVALFSGDPPTVTMFGEETTSDEDYQNAGSLTYGTWFHVILEAGLVGTGPGFVHVTMGSNAPINAIGLNRVPRANIQGPTIVYVGAGRFDASTTPVKLTVHVDNVVGTILR